MHLITHPPTHPPTHTHTMHAIPEHAAPRVPRALPKAMLLSPRAITCCAFIAWPPSSDACHQPQVHTTASWSSPKTTDILPNIFYVGIALGGLVRGGEGHWHGEKNLLRWRLEWMEAHAAGVYSCAPPLYSVLDALCAGIGGADSNGDPCAMPLAQPWRERLAYGYGRRSAQHKCRGMGLVHLDTFHLPGYAVGPSCEE